MDLSKCREKYHSDICNQILRIIRKSGKEAYPNNADGSNLASRQIAWGLYERIHCSNKYSKLSGQTVGNKFEIITRNFLENTFSLLEHLRPGKWEYSINKPISCFDQYSDLAKIEEIIKLNRELATTLGKDYIVSPDIIISRVPVTDNEINVNNLFLNLENPLARLTPLRKVNYESDNPILHASISCKWTLRSDRAQNTRTEALNLIRSRKGKLPHIVAVTAEPTPIRIASLALGTGDIDCVYHIALHELRESIESLGNADQLEMLDILVHGRRLRDISDLPFDLAI
ncbi:MAG: NgoMIV family type II restriction endonuclease [Candidatus Kapaibacterium sp.]